MFKGSTIAIVVVLTIIALISISTNFVSKEAVPSINDFLASSTAPFQFSTSTRVFSTGSSTPDVKTDVLVSKNPISEYTIPFKTPSGIFRVFVASSTEQLNHGLSGRPSLADDRGLLFMFKTPSKPGFWMKDMSFPIDIIWIASNKKVIGIERNVTIESYPNLYFPPTNIKYVLEINAGNSAAWGLATGTLLHF